MKKYIHYAKAKTPVLVEEAASFISETYSQLRDKRDDNQYRTMPITPRTLETLIRLSTAHAKCRLSPTVDVVDAEVAKEILEYALYKIVKEPETKPSKKKRVKTTNKPPAADGKDDSDSSDETDSDDDDDNTQLKPPSSSSHKMNIRGKSGTQMDEDEVEEQQTQTQRTNKTNKSASTKKSDSQSQGGLSDLIESTQNSKISGTAVAPTSDDMVSQEMFSTFREKLFEVREPLAIEGIDIIMTHDLIQKLNSKLPASQKFTVQEAKSILTKMSEENLLWYQDDMEQITFI